MAEPSFGMDKAEFKKLLTASKKQPVQCGVGMTKDGVVIKLHKMKQGRALTAELQKDHKDMKSPHWGEAVVDMDEDPSLVILKLNKPASGMARKLKKILKGTGFSKIEIRLEDGTVAEKVGDEEDEATPEAGAASASPAAASPPAASAPAAPDAAPAAEMRPAPPDIMPPDPPVEAAAPEPPAPPVQQAAPEPPAAAAAQPAPPTPAAPDTGALTRQLTDLVKQLAGVLAADPSRGATLKDHAVAAQTSLKSGDAAGAQQSIAALQQALGQASAAPSPPAGPNGANAPAPPNMAAFGKAKVAWVATRQRVEGELGKLHAKMTEVYKGHGFAADLDRVFHTRVEPMLTALDHSLSEKLEEVSSNKDGAQHAKLVGEARQIIARYESYIASEPLIAKLDANPFVPLAVQKTLTSTLTALSKAVV